VIPFLLQAGKEYRIRFGQRQGRQFKEERRIEV
jgi:hypothetical protein